MFEKLRKIFKSRKSEIPLYANPKSRIFIVDNNWVEIKPFTRRDHIIFVLYNFKAKDENKHAEHNRFYIELESPDEIRDFMEWLDGSVSSLLYNNIRAYMEIDYDGHHFIQVTNYGMYKNWQWSSMIDKKHIHQIKDHIKSNWSERPYVKPVRKSINLGRSHTSPGIALTNNT
jgi:hypothetical protein